MPCRTSRAIARCASASSRCSTSGARTRAAAGAATAAVAAAPPSKKLEDGFFTIAGAAVDAAGTLYFVDHHQQRIFSWSAARGLSSCATRRSIR